MYKIDQTPYVLQIAKQDEFGLTHQFDISEWLAEYPDLTVGIAVVRPEETEDDAEPATTVIDGTTMTVVAGSASSSVSLGLTTAIPTVKSGYSASQSDISNSCVNPYSFCFAICKT